MPLRRIEPGEKRYVDLIDEQLREKYVHIEVSADDVRFYRENQAQHAAKKKNRINVSEYFDCAFKIFASLTELPKQPIESKIEWDYGNTRAIKVHDAYQAAYTEAQALKIVNGQPASEMWLNKQTVGPEKGAIIEEKRIAGRIDLWFVDETFGELKTITDKDTDENIFFALKKNKWDKQTQLGMWLCGVKTARIIAINRDRNIFSNVYELECTVDENFIENSLVRIDKIWEHVERERERQASGFYQFTSNKNIEYPPAEYWKGSCPFCAYGFNGSGVCSASAAQQKHGKRHPDYIALNAEHKKRAV